MGQDDYSILVLIIIPFVIIPSFILLMWLPVYEKRIDNNQYIERIEVVEIVDAKIKSKYDINSEERVYKDYEVKNNDYLCYFYKKDGKVEQNKILLKECNIYEDLEIETPYLEMIIDRNGEPFDKYRLHINSFDLLNH